MGIYDQSDEISNLFLNDKPLAADVIVSLQLMIRRIFHQCCFSGIIYSSFLIEYTTWHCFVIESDAGLD